MGLVPCWNAYNSSIPLWGEGCLHSVQHSLLIRDGCSSRAEMPCISEVSSTAGACAVKQLEAHSGLSLSSTICIQYHFCQQPAGLWGHCIRRCRVGTGTPSGHITRNRVAGTPLLVSRSLTHHTPSASSTLCNFCSAKWQMTCSCSLCHSTSATSIDSFNAG